MSWRFAKKVLSSWYWWGFVILWVIAGETESFSSNGLLALYMKSHPTIKYAVWQLNNYPAGVPAAGIVSTLFFATLTDFLGGRRWVVGYFIAVTGIATSGMILAASKDPTNSMSTAVVFGAYYWAGSVYACQATFFAWCNDAMRYEDHMFRAVVLAGMNLGSNVFNAWWSIVFYGASMAPWFIVSYHPPPPLSGPHHDTLLTVGSFVQRGMWAMVACSILLAIWTAGLSYMAKRDHDGRRVSGQAASERAELEPVDEKAAFE